MMLPTHAAITRRRQPFHHFRRKKPLRTTDEERKNAGLFRKAKCFFPHLLSLGIHKTLSCFSVKHSPPTVDSKRNSSYTSWNNWVVVGGPPAPVRNQFRSTRGWKQAPFYSTESQGQARDTEVEHYSIWFIHNHIILVQNLQIRRSCPD